MRRIIYVDLDRTLADFELMFFRVTGKRLHEVTDAEMWAVIDKYDAAGGNWFTDLPFMPDGRELWDYVDAHGDGRILTATGRNEGRASAQKRQWCIQRLGIDDSRIHTVRRSEDKARFAQPGVVLIDDHLTRSIASFIAAGGIGIHHSHTTLTIAHLKSLGVG